MPAILRLREVTMRRGIRLLAACAISIAANAAAQLGPSQPYPISGASPRPPLMQIDQKDRIAVVDVTVGPDGRTIDTRLVTRSGSGVFDERVRGFWKGQPFLPALDATGRPRAATLRIRNQYSVKPMSRGVGLRKNGEGFHFNAEVLDQNPIEVAARIEHMTCRDFLWDYDFMQRIAPKAQLWHEDLFHVAFAMLIAAKKLSNESRDALIHQWEPLTGQTVDSCRAQPDAKYFKDAFVHIFESATPVGVTLQ
jgi:hypothetical protein